MVPIYPSPRWVHNYPVSSTFSHTFPLPSDYFEANPKHTSFVNLSWYIVARYESFLKKFPQYHGEGIGTPLQYSCLENPMDRGAWWAAVHGVAKSQARLSDFTFTFHFHALEKEMATHSSVLAWRIPGTAEPDGLPSKGSHRVRHDWSNLVAAAVTKSWSQIK